AVVAEAQAARGVGAWYYSLDFNERCRDVAALLEFLSRLRERSPAAFGRVAYIEQPTARDLEGNRHNVMHEAARLRPVVIDESLIDLRSLQLAREMGYTGAALKACKGQSQSLLLAAAAREYGMFLCVQDLTCPGASLIHSAGLAAHVPGVAAIEANARQYVPAANQPWEARFPGVFRVTDGTLATGTLTGPGLGALEAWPTARRAPARGNVDYTWARNVCRHRAQGMLHACRAVYLPRVPDPVADPPGPTRPGPLSTMREAFPGERRRAGSGAVCARAAHPHP